MLDTALWYYFGDSLAVPAVPLPATLPLAIIERAEATPGLDAVEGGVNFGVVTDNPGRRYIAFFLISGGTTYTTGKPFHERPIFQFDAYAPTHAEAMAMIDLLKATFRPGMTPTLAWQGGTVAHAHVRNQGVDPEELQADDGTRLIRHHVDIQFLTNQASP